MLPSIDVNGLCSQDLIERIKQYQDTCGLMKNPDGRVDAGGRTFKSIITQAKPNAGKVKELLFGPSPGSTGWLVKVNPQLFRKLYIKQSGLGLTITKGEDLLVFFGFLQNDPEINDIRWAAYMLATVAKETGKSFKPVEEDKKGGVKKYADPEQVVDHLGCRGPKNKVYTNKYYGRGYVQVTWPKNYKKIGKLYGIGDELYINPKRALNKKIAYFAASYGMRFGVFTGHKLSTHINGNTCNYIKARKIINGDDDCKEIADWAAKIEILLRLCANPITLISNDHILCLC